mmetsp:Transcript_12189/g.37171  ORF Transcript_12189/g.37171 Transcript_12189/m.37171 type:complete len:207 (+) Transcript_12189:436-1056(+)|eukprot:CAMPEP_0198731908 /NCGR_PEP_ID=MMETSP1475-20131203/32849_1 /TAXON_ID= ORGANISM="Unidentified sp., Strain CCMP1999" /NCGR_SAMPLE_ID=MMETSP1475 /ASSEMBLY_ACC=CAM_ASM_001111 /LENGTH=206 /DNA_ID=CAMNT_0044494931 /DNA_START=374 /DNA_END=994 /DNA_ORIENTATION=-
MDDDAVALMANSSVSAERDDLDLSDWDQMYPESRGTVIDESGWFANNVGSSTSSMLYLDSDVATQAIILEQQRKIEELEGDLSNAQAEIRILRSQAINSEEEKKKKKSSSGDNKKSTSRYWTSEEHQKFLEGLAKFGHKDVKAISNYVATRNATQVRTHAQKYYLRLSREAARNSDKETSQVTNKSGQESHRSSKIARTEKATAVN